MLALTLKDGEAVQIGPDVMVRLQVDPSRGGRYRLYVSAPREWNVSRLPGRRGPFAAPYPGARGRAPTP